MLGWLASVAIQNVCPGEESKAGMLLKVTIKVFFPLCTSPWCPFSVVPQDGWPERGRKQASWCAFFLVCSLSWVHLFTSELSLHSWWPVFFSKMGIWQGEGLYSQFAFLIILTVDWLIERWRNRPATPMLIRTFRVHISIADSLLKESASFLEKCLLLYIAGRNADLCGCSGDRLHCLRDLHFHSPAMNGGKASNFCTPLMGKTFISYHKKWVSLRI